MLPRYIDNLRIRRTQDGSRYYATLITNPIPVDAFQLTITAQDGDRFDSLATKYYKDASKWWIIAKANNLLNGTMMVPGGTQLVIPSAGLL
jgi:nucleoid-associated protein YgaU